ncbi:hypothetical protein [Microbacterium sp.]|uniref:hypothetical protein n=1 Tax=Microbacterium sp. TaxID=51671 RepID=UPI003F6F7F1B
MLRRTSLALAACAALALALAACATDPGGSATTPPPSHSPGPSLTPSPDPTDPPSAANLPTDCAQVGTAATRAATVDQMTLQGDGVGFVRPAPQGATLALGCDWIQGDATGFLLLISTTDTAAADAAITDLGAQGWTCGAGPQGEGDTCTLTTPNEQFPVDTVETVVTRGDVWIYSSATNVDGAALLSDLQTSIWAS